MLHDEIWMMLGIAFVLLCVGSVFMHHYPKLAPWPGRIGTGIFLVLLGSFINRDGGFHSSGMRMLMSASLACLSSSLLKIALPVGYAIFGQGIADNLSKGQAAFRTRIQQARERAQAARQVRIREHQRQLDAQAATERKQIEAEIEAERQRREAEEWERTRPERERKAREQALRDRQEQQRRDAEAREHQRLTRIRDASLFRLKCQFERLRNRLPSQCSPNWFHDRIHEFLPSGVDEDEFLARADELSRLLDDLCTGGGNVNSVSKLRKKFEAIRQEIADAGYPDDIREEYEVRINRSEMEALRGELGV